MKFIRKCRSISINKIVTVTFLSLLCLSVGLIQCIVFSNWNASTKETLINLAQHVNQDVMGRIDTFLQTPFDIGELNYKVIKNDILDLNNEKARDKFFVGVLSSCDQNIYSFSYGSSKGEYYGARRNEQGTIEIMKNNAATGGQSWYYSVKDDLTKDKLKVNAGAFDPRRRVWYKAAVQESKPVFSPVYKHFVMNDLTISAAWPIYNDKNSLQGVMGIHILLSDIGDQLKNIVKRDKGVAFIVEKDTGYLIANSLGKSNFTIKQDGTLERKTLGDIGQTELSKTYQQYQQEGQENAYIKADESGYFANIQEYKQSGLDWLIISAVPEHLLTDELYRNIRIAILLVIVTIVLSFGAHYIITRRLLRPIRDLLIKAERFSAGDLSQRVVAVRNDEIGRIADAFNKVADNMQFLINGLEDTVVSRTDQLHKANEVLDERQSQLRLILDSTAEAIYGTDLFGNCTFCNESCLSLLGYAESIELLGKNMHLLIHHSKRDGTPFLEEDCLIRQTLLHGEGVYSRDDVFWKADGTCFDVEYRALPQFQNGRIVGSVVTFIDITEQKRNEEQINFLYCHDPMTGLMNRRCFEDKMKTEDTEGNLPVSAIFIDLNGLKMINDTFGHASGDELIIKAAEVLKENCRERDIVARVGGDEFAVLLPKTTTDEATSIAQRLKDKYAKKKINVISCSMALGVDTKTKPYQKMEKIIENAESEMYKEKAISKKRFGTKTLESIIGALHEKCPWEKKHSEEVSHLCVEIGMVMELPRTEIKKLSAAGYLHDIGKIASSEALYGKRTEDFTEAEKEMMRQHPAVGYRILNLSEETLDIAEVVYAHHERWDGLGYPKGLKQEEIPVLSRIIAIAETYERILHQGDYTEEGKEEALKFILENAGKLFDPDIVTLFEKIMKKSRSLL